MVVTFTEAAAAEMKERIRGAIERSWRRSRKIFTCSGRQP
ncbi:MAG: UvrD-helicase domain-containing protein [Sellimonas intestinalis]